MSIRIQATALLKRYIECNIELRREAEKEGNKIKNQNAKLRNSDIFGKWMKNPMSKVHVKIVTTRKQYSNGHLDQPLKETNNFVTKQWE